MSPLLLQATQLARPPRAAPSRRGLDVAIAGTRGVPACYGGFETFAEELGRRLVGRGHRVTVYGRAAWIGHRRREHLGMRVVPVRAPLGKHVETPLHTLLSALRARRAGHDVVLLCNAANAFTLPLWRWGGATTLVNVDGIERQRRKWGGLGRLWYALSERLTLRLADQALADADVIRSYYRDRHGVELPMIPYGGDRTPPRREPQRLARFGLDPGRYVLAVGRLEPENNALLVARAYRRVGGELPLVIVGDAPYARAYKLQLRAAADRRTRLVGAVYGPDYLALQQHAACYVAAGEVGGTHPALLEAMAMGGPVVAHDVPEHREVLGEAGLYFARRDERSLARELEQVLTQPELGRELRQRARARVERGYRWDEVALAYEALFERLLAGRRDRRTA